jgi:putative transport protein
MFKSLLTGTGIPTAILYISLTAFIGVPFGKIKFKGVKLGIAGVLFSGLLIAHLGAVANPEILHFVREFGLILITL